jgi:putative transposase
MKTLRRYQRQGTFFITVCTYQRKPVLLKDAELFWNSWKDVRPSAWVILPDHFHVIIHTQDSDLSEIVHSFKIAYSRSFRDHIRSGRVWQNRFWDHYIRNELDYERHLNYIHFNPVKHGLTDDPLKYQYSSIMKFCDSSDHVPDWELVKEVESREFGE